MQSTEQIVCIQKRIIQAFALFKKDLNDNRTFYFSKDIACIDKSCNNEYLYSNIVTILVNRMLKLLMQILNHRLHVENDLLLNFKDIAECKTKLTKRFQLTQKRISAVEKELTKVNIETKNKQALKPTLTQS